MVNPYRFYTYAYLREDRTPYYIGKGQTRRIYQKNGKPCGVPKDKSRIIFLKKNLLEEEAFKHEIYMINVFGRIDIGTGILYNKTNGGDGSSGALVSEETRQKISQSNKGRVAPNKGILHTEDTKRKISEANTGKVSCWKGKNLPKELVEKMKLTKKMKGDNVGEKNPRAKTWKITFDNGKSEIVKALQVWAKENGYKPTSVRNLYNGNGVKKYKNIVSVEELSNQTTNLDKPCV
jgi:hypothetical protein